MVKRYIIVLIICICSGLHLYSQSASIGLLGDFSTLKQREMKTLGISVELFVKKNLALNYTVRIGETHFFNYHNRQNNFINGKGFNYKMSPGFVVGYWLLKNYNGWGGNPDDWKVFVAALLIPEGITYYFDIKKQYSGRKYTRFRSVYNTGHKIGIYMNPLSVEGWNLNRQNHKEYSMCLETGIKSDIKLTRNLSLKPYVGFRLQYSRVFSGFNSGFSINYNVD